MSEFIITRKLTLEPNNIVYFADDLGDALEIQAEMTWEEPKYEWIIAQIYPQSGMLMRFVKWLKKVAGEDRPTDGISQALPA